MTFASNNSQIGKNKMRKVKSNSSLISLTETASYILVRNLKTKYISQFVSLPN